jgi:hypothetical protein
MWRDKLAPVSDDRRRRGGGGHDIDIYNEEEDRGVELGSRKLREGEDPTEVLKLNHLRSWRRMKEKVMPKHDHHHFQCSY